MSENRSYSSDYFTYERLNTRAVQVGNLRIGENARIAIQSMTNTNSLDTEATVAQCIRIFDAGADLVRISVQGIAEAENLKNIKQQLLEKGYTKPISADVHFNPKIAEVAAKYVEKVRINPGNYAEIMNQIDDSDEKYLEAIHRISRKLKPLIQICKKHQTSIRIGVNHGSLSKRILSRYGDTPEGMVESALEYVKLFEQADFPDLIISLKSSNVLTMVHANRLLASRMQESGKVYPIHLGLTEAGNGLEGRQKSVAGIATLLQDGIGDTVRVSLTEAPEHEIPVLKELFKWIPKTISNQSETKSAWFSPFHYFKRESISVNGIGGTNPAVVILRAAQRNNCKVGKPFADIETPPPDFLFLGKEKPIFYAADQNYIQDIEVWDGDEPNCFPILHLNELKNFPNLDLQNAFIKLDLSDVEEIDKLEELTKMKQVVLVLRGNQSVTTFEWRKAFYLLYKAKIKLPVILHTTIHDGDNQAFLVQATQAFSPILLDGFGNGIWLEEKSCVHFETLKQISFGILQSCRLRQTKTEYIACPSCARTLFDIEKRLAEVRKATLQYSHLKIAVMGCIVNGPGEMADADYGYVGSGKGKVHLYKGSKLIAKSISEENACNALVEIIKQEGDWRK